MALSLAQLTKAVTEEEALEQCLDILAALGYNARSWRDGDVHYTVVRLMARLKAADSQVVASIAGAHFNDTAVDDWLELYARSHYANDKKPTLATQGTAILTAVAAAPGPFNISPSDLVAADTVRGLTFRNITGGTLNAGGTLSLTFEAEVAGQGGDISSNTLTILKTPLAGVSINNPTPVGAASWITRNGGDAESNESLRIRNSSRWATVGSAGTPSLAYVNFALNAHASVRRVAVDDKNPRGPNTLDIYVAGDAGDLSSTVVQAVQDYIDGSTDGVGRKASGSNVLVLSATRNDIPYRATIYMVSQYNTAANQQKILDAVSAYHKVLPIGGTRVNLDGNGVVVFG